MKKASYYKQLPDNRVQCLLCPHHCKLSNGKKGICLTRENRDGVLYSTNYLRPVSIAIDPIEKKPLYHFYPGSNVFSTGPNGCTFKCTFCQNWEISQNILSVPEIPMDILVKRVITSGSKGIAYTYSEPYIWFETIMDIHEHLKDSDMKAVMVTNGFMEDKPLRELIRFIDAMNVDIKSINPRFYKKLCKGTLRPVLNTCETVVKYCHLEITNLLIPGENDSEQDIIDLVDYVASYLGKNIPLHISRYFPRYKMFNKATPEISLNKAWEIASEKLDYVYIGNLYADNKSDTYCPSCHTLLIKRNGYSINISDTLGKDLQGKGICKKCRFEINIAI